MEDTVETTIVGVTESGVIRKRSVKRRKPSDVIPTVYTYGHNKEAYSQIAQRVLHDHYVTKALEVLLERWRMTMYMYEDCMQAVKKWDELRRLKKHRKRKRRLLLLSFLLLPVLVIWLISQWL